MTTEQCNILLSLLVASLGFQAISLLATVFYSDAILRQAKKAGNPSPDECRLRNLQEWTKDIMERVVELKSLSAGRESSLGTAAVMQQHRLNRQQAQTPPPPDVPQGGGYRVVSTG